MTAIETLVTAANDAAMVVSGLVPDPDPVQPPGTEGVGTAMSWLKWTAYAVVGGAIIVGGMLIAINFRRGEGHDALPKILWPVAGTIVIGSGAAIVGTIAGG